MKLQLIHLSDIHFENKTQPFEINIDKMLQAIKTTEQADECVIIMSGDLAAKGELKEYKYVGSLLGAILKFAREKYVIGKSIEVMCVPGNHDIDFSRININISDILSATKRGKIKDIFEIYLKNMKNFFSFAKYRKCFLDDNVVSKKIIIYNGRKIGFVMLNTAPLSVLGGAAEDMGNHFFSEEQLSKIENATEADINVLIMHHSIEWFENSCKDRLRKIISRKYSLVLTGHEHEPVGESRNINNLGAIQCIQGNALHGYAEDGNGFCTINIDLQTDLMVGYSYLWKDGIYVPHKILDSKAKTCSYNDLIVKQKFIQEIEADSFKRKIDDYYVFPGITYEIFSEDEEFEKNDVEKEEELFELVSKYSKIIIRGEHKSGKSVLAKRIHKRLLREGKLPVLINANDINKKKIEKTIEYTFNEQYETDNNAYEKFKQKDISDKVVLFDEANLISKNTFIILLDFLERNFGQVIIFSEEKINLDIKRQVVNSMVEKKTLQLDIKPFLYVKRKKLISNILSSKIANIQDIEKETTKINDLINMQIKYFQLDPEFIINFVNQYESEYGFQFSSGMNVFNIVYESTIKNRIISNSENIDATIVINILRELAYYMHFKRKNSVRVEEISGVITQYSNVYRQKVNTRLFIETALNAKILVENICDIRFKDHTLVAYFVAQALNQKYNQDEDINENLNNLLKNLCFSINSDIVLFLALITNNPKFVNIIIEGAKKHFAYQEEMSFDKKNVKFLLDTSISVKNTTPDKKEKEQREEIIQKQEEDARLSDLIELVNEYDYSEEDLQKMENQVMISFKYLEILSKALPAFCQNMKAEQQDKLVAVVYRCPNQFLYTIFKDISENFEQFCNELYREVSVLRKEKNIINVNLDSIRHVIEQVSAGLIIAIYQLVAATCTTEQSIGALNAFEFNLNTNYKYLKTAKFDDDFSYGRYFCFF